MQWIPSHCNLLGNEAADSLAKEETKQEQTVRSTSYNEVKTIIKAKQQKHWIQQHQLHTRTDPYHSLTRCEQVMIFRLRTGHNCLNHHMHTKFCISTTEQSPCGTGSQTTEHLLQSCPLYTALRQMAGLTTRQWPGNCMEVWRTCSALPPLS